jgi:hypothetical protein
VQKGKWILELYGKYGINPEWFGIGKGKMFIAERDGYTMPSVHHSAALS